MNIPEGHTEESVLEAVEKAVSILSQSFIFGYYDIDDIKQEGRVLGMECLAKYDPKRPLANFVYTHIRNRLINLRRNKFRRNDPPCKACHEGSPCGAEGTLCERYASWLGRNNARVALMRPMKLERLGEERERRRDDTVAHAALQEALTKLDAGLSPELRADWLRMKDGARVPKARRLLVEAEVRGILGETWAQNAAG